MVNYYGTARSNYINWNAEKLQALLTLFPVSLARKPNQEGVGHQIALISEDEIGTPSPAFIDYDDEDQVNALVALGVLETADEVEIDKLLDQDTLPGELDFLEAVSMAFAEDPGGLFVWVYSGSEKSRYIDGGALAMDAEGNIVHQININDIHDLEDVNTEAQY